MVLKAVAIAALLGVVPLEAAQAGSPTKAVDRLMQAAYFSPACWIQAETIAVPLASDVAAVMAAFATRGDVLRKGDCANPAVLLINLLRRHGFDAEIALIAEPAPANRVARLAVYIPGANTYVDPEHALGADQLVLDRDARLRRRYHFAGPTLAATGTFRCASTCLWQHGPDRPDIRRVKAISIPAAETP